MGIFSSLFQKEKEPERLQEYDLEEPVKRQPVAGSKGQLAKGMHIDVMNREGEYLLTGQIVEFSDDTLTVERLPGELSFKVIPLNADVTLNGYDRRLIPVSMSAVVEQSTRTTFKVKDMKMEDHSNVRSSFRLPLSTPVSLYRQDDEHYRRPEDCQLVNISTGGCCVESEYVHMEDEVLRVRIKLEEYSPLNFLGQIVRCSEHRPGKYWYGILFAQLTEKEADSLNRTLFNLQMGIRETHIHTEDGPWGSSSRKKSEEKR